MTRRRSGATLSLVIVVILVIIVLGVGAYFLMKILGGGREVANATDAGTLAIARDSLVKVTVPAPTSPTDLSDMAYPQGSGQISLLTYNRAVAKAMLIALNASQMNSGQATANAKAVMAEVNTLGNSLNSKLQTVWQNYSDLANSTKMFGNNGVQPSSGSAAFMKAGESTNVYFPQNIAAQLGGVPWSTGATQPVNGFGVNAGPSKYLGGYKPITVQGIGTVYGAPVFPQFKPHLVSLFNFNAASGQIGSAPPNSFKVQTSSLDSKSNVFGGAVACALVGAINSGGSAGGPLGNGFEAPASIPYGYIEFDNWAANSKPPGYDENQMNDNIFNNELGKDIWATGDAGQNSQNIAFSSESGVVENWVTWAANGASPPYPGGDLWVQAAGNATGRYLNQVNAGNPPDASQIQWLKSMASGTKPKENPAPNCYQQLSQNAIGLMGSCVGSFGNMQKTFTRYEPSLGTQNSQQSFSQADWAKSVVIVAFEGKPLNQAGAVTQGQAGYNNSVAVDLTIGAPISGLGVYQFIKQGAAKVPNPPPAMQVPSPQQMPLQKDGSIYDLISMVQDPGCRAQTIKDITLRCQEIQPKTTPGQVLSLLQNTMLPMAAPNPSPSNANAKKVYIYLPGADLSQTLVCNGTQPPKFTGQDPDGNQNSNPCYTNTYSLNGSIVDSNWGNGSPYGDEMVHQAPYLDITPNTPPGLYVTDTASWWAGSGAQNIMGRMVFTEAGFGNSTFQHIN